MKKFKQLGLIGCGMMGGSFALAAKRAGLVERVVGYNKSPNKAELAKRMSVIDDAAASILQAVMGADLVLISVPVAATFDVLKAVQFGLHKEALILDVGSTKQSVIAAAESVFGMLPPNFVPSHPIAGKEQAGIEAADADLYAGKRVILTPTQRTDDAALANAEAVWKSLGMTISRMAPNEHDAVFAAVSHLPHLLGFAYMNGIAGQSEAQQFLQMAGPGFQDFTRIAAGDPELWSDIFLANGKEILKQSNAMLMSLKKLEDAMRCGNPQTLKDLIATASALRSGWTLNKTVSVNDE
jgi:prephenate dehydrogenase